MSLSRTELSEEKRNEIKLKFFEKEKTKHAAIKDECVIDGMILVGSPVYAFSAYLFLTGACTYLSVLIPPIALGAYLGRKIGKSAADCLFKENTNPTDEQLLDFNEQSKFGYSR